MDFEELIAKAGGAESALRLLMSAFDQSGDAIGVSDISGAHLFHNAAYERLFGCTVPEINALGGFQCLYKRRHDTEGLVSAVKSGLAWEGEVELRRPPKGRSFMAAVKYLPVRGDDGKVLASIGVYSDISERKRKDKELKEAARLLKSLLDSSGAAVVAIDSECKPALLNPAAETLLGWTLAELAADSGEAAKSFLHGIGTIASESPGISVRTEIASRSHALNVAVMCIPCRLEDGRNGSMCMMTDISRELAMDRHACKTRKMEALGLLAGGIAHDFNNILSAILGYTELCIMHEELQPHMKRHLEQVMIAGNRAKDLVGQILTFCSKSDKKPETLDPSLMVKEAVKMLRPAMPPSVTIKETRLSEGETILADPAQIHQMISSLCMNAAYAMKNSGGSIIVSLSVADSARRPGYPEGRHLELSISDSGPGIAPKIADRIFDPFFTTKPSGEGTGMGLAVVHGIVSDLKGRIIVESEPGKGATFRVLIPSSKKGETCPRHRLPSIKRGSGRLMVIDDEVALTDMMVKALGDIGYDVKGFTDSAAALEAFKESPHHFDLIVSDHVMPNLTGAQFASEAMKIRPGMPVLILTGYGDPSLLSHAESSGVGRTLLKPMSIDELASVVHDEISRKGG